MALSALFIFGMGLVLNSTDKIMIGAIIGTREAGIYVAVSRTAAFTLFGINAVNVVLGPMISALHSSDKREDLQRLLMLAARGGFAFMVPVGAVLVLWGRHVLGFFGAEFVEGYTPLVILAAAQMVNALAGSVGVLLVMTGHQRLVCVILTASVLLNVLLNAILIPAYGLSGAAAATGSTTVLWNVLLLVYVSKRMGLNPTVFASARGGRGERG
jgi:O-antigen/teichoic acid export membrane protein